MVLPFVSGRLTRGGSFAAGPAVPVADTGISEQSILDLSPSWWMDADVAYVYESTDDSDPVEADEDLVKFWKDKSGNGANFVKTNDAKLPKWYEAGQNDLPYLHFTAADFLKHDATANHGTPMAMYFVMSFDTDTQSGSLFTYSTTSGSNITNRQHAFAGDKALILDFGSDGSPTFGNAQSTDTRILQIHVTDSARKIRANGGASLSEVYGGSANSQTENLVASGADLYFFYSGNYKVYEHLMIPDVTHSEDDVFTYLGEKYDISVTAVS